MPRRPNVVGARRIRSRRTHLCPRVIAAFGLVTVGSMVLASCGSLEGLVGEQEVQSDSATVAVLVPSDDPGDANSAGVIAAVRAAVDESTGDLSNWDVSVEVVPTDDDDTDTVDALEELLDDDLVAVIGGLSSASVRAAQPVLDARDVVFVSPADTVAQHTRGADPTSPLRPYDSYFRTAVADAPAVTAAMRHAAAVDGVESITILDTEGGDDPAVGASAVEAAGLSVVEPEQPEQPEEEEDDDSGEGDEGDAGSEGADTSLTGPISGTTEFNARMDAAVATDADGLYAAVAPNRARLVLERLADDAPDMTVFGGAAFADDSPPQRRGFSGSVLRGVAPGLATTMNATPDQLTGALGDTSPGRYGAAAYDAGKVVGTVLTTCLPSAASASSARTGCLGEMDQVRVTGVTGDIAFDDFGDRVGGTAAVEAAVEGTWQPVVGE